MNPVRLQKMTSNYFICLSMYRVSDVYRQFSDVHRQLKESEF